MPKHSYSPDYSSNVTGLISSTEAAAMIGITAHHLAQLRFKHEGPDYVRISGRCVKYDPRTVSAWITSRIVKSEA